MSPIRLIVIVIGLAAAIGAAFLLRSALSDSADAVSVPQIQLAPQPEVTEVEVLVSLRDLQVGEVLRAEDLAWAPWPEASVNFSQILRSDEPDALEEKAGSLVRIPIFEREPILTRKIVSRGDTGIMAALVSPGMRAVSVEISVETASGGFILPEDRVDVILTHEVVVNTAEGTEDQIRSDIVLENVRVLAIDQGITAGEDNTTYIGSTATLELSPKDAALIAFGERKGVMSLALRSLSDAALAGDVVTSHGDAVTARGNDGRVTIIRNGRVQGSVAAASGE